MAFLHNYPIKDYLVERNETSHSYTRIVVVEPKGLTEEFSIGRWPSLPSVDVVGTAPRRNDFRGDSAVARMECSAPPRN